MKFEGFKKIDKDEFSGKMKSINKIEIIEYFDGEKWSFFIKEKKI